MYTDMKNAIIYLVALLALVGSAVAQCGPGETIVGGQITELDHVTPVSGATVTVDCNGVTESATSLADGSYVVCYDKEDCTVGQDAYVSAVKDGASGDNNGKVIGRTMLDVAIVNVSIPEFGVVAAGTVLVGSVVLFAMMRKSN
jgi:hypothetical protein